MGAAEQRFQVWSSAQRRHPGYGPSQREANMLQSSESNHTHVEMNAATISSLFLLSG